MNFKELRIGGSPPVAAAPEGPERLYSGPVLLREGEAIAARAFRLGFRPSPEEVFRFGDEDRPAPPATARPHWREEVTRRGIIPRCIALKRLDGTGEREVAGTTLAEGC